MWVRNFHNMGASGTEALFIWDDRATEDGGLLRLIGVEIRHSIGGERGACEKVGAKLSPCTEALVETVGGAKPVNIAASISPLRASALVFARVVTSKVTEICIHSIGIK